MAATWQEVSSTNEQTLTRTTQIISSGDPRTQLLPLNEQVLANAAALDAGGAFMYYYAGAGFEMAAKLTFQPKSNRYLVCYGVAGQVPPQTGLDLIFDKTYEFAQQFSLQYVYGARPKKMSSPLLQQIYDLAAHDPRVQETLVADLPDITIYRISYVQSP